MRRAWLWLVVTAGCGRFGFGDSALGAKDAVDGDALPSDLGLDAFVVCHTGSWSMPQPLNMVDTASHESDPTVTADGLLMFYVSNRVPGQQYAIWSANRASVTDPFANTALVPELDSAADDFDPSISPDGLTIYFDSDRGIDQQIWTASRSAITQPFGTPTLVTITGEPTTRSSSPFVTADGLELYYTEGGLEIAYATRSIASGPFAFVRELDEVNVAPTDGAPNVSSDGLELLFESFRTGTSATFRSTRASKADMWGPEVEVTELATLLPGTTGHGGPELTPDGRTLYLFENITSVDLYVTTRDCN